jgi:hypothetical protein
MLELMEGRVRLGEGLLHQVLGVGRVSRHTEGGGVKLVEVGHNVRLEPLATLLQRLWHGTHPLTIVLVAGRRQKALRGKTVRGYLPGSAGIPPA